MTQAGTTRPLLLRMLPFVDTKSLQTVHHRAHTVTHERMHLVFSRVQKSKKDQAEGDRGATLKTQR